MIVSVSIEYAMIATVNQRARPAGSTCDLAAECLDEPAQGLAFTLTPATHLF
ncbi:hypothetical protein [Thermogemmatispora onikobensis]|uniref:hypothetical protein n=1 Tax=Thermogemmatispora onikobensis TaxID=732234 RepID=UPI00159F06F9|nr:hypothetical protein [Thermogemmatispora onikobensis]